MPSEQPTDYRVTLSKRARVLEYEDSLGQLLFTFDLGSKFDPSKTHNNSLVLEHHSAHPPQTYRYKTAFERTKQYLESLGYEVDVNGE
jgi:hypothetical protein